MYVNNDLESKLKDLREWMEERNEGNRVLIGGVFNARTWREGGKVKVEEWREAEEGSSRSKDVKMNREGKRLYKFLEELEWTILK